MVTQLLKSLPRSAATKRGIRCTLTSRMLFSIDGLACVRVGRAWFAVHRGVFSLLRSGNFTNSRFLKQFLVPYPEINHFRLQSSHLQQRLSEGGDCQKEEAVRRRRLSEGGGPRRRRLAEGGGCQKEEVPG
jgi:hypothetical protein